eukprot:523169_1
MASEEKNKDKFVKYSEFEALEKAYAKLQQEHDLLKQKTAGGVQRNRHSKQFWEDIENKLKNDTDSVKKLIKDKVILMNDVNDNGWTLLQFAAYIGNYQITQLCINLGANLHHKNDDGNTALEESQEAVMSHTEQLLLFSEMEASIGERIKTVSFSMNKQTGIIENIEKGLKLIGPQSKQIFMKTCIELMVSIISQKLSFSDDLLMLCWKYQQEMYTDITQSELYQTIRKVCRDIIGKKVKRDWFWFLKCIIPSNIWYTITDQLEERKLDDTNNSTKNATVIFRKTKKYFYYELLKMVKVESELQLEILEKNLTLEANANLIGWNKLISFSLNSEDLVQMDSKTPRQDVIPNGIVGEFGFDALNYDASNASFDGAKFYDHHQYLSKITLLAQIVDDSFHKSIKHIFNINQFTGIGIIEDEKEDIFTYYSRGPVKLLERARAKAENDYFAEAYPTSACIIDLNRCSLLFTNINS